DARIGGGARRCRRDRVVGLELDHRPHDEPERSGGSLDELELRDEPRVEALAGLVAGEEVVAERFDHVIERHAAVRDRAGAQHDRQGAQEHARRTDLAALVLRGRRTEPRTEQLVRAIEEMDLHARSVHCYNLAMPLARQVVAILMIAACGKPTGTTMHSESAKPSP